MAQPPRQTSFTAYLAMTAATVAALLLGAVGFIWHLHKRGEMVAIPFSGNMSLDEKMELIRDRPSSLDCDVLAVGSSMALNNLDSESLLNNLPSGTKYFNIGAWGLKISDTCNLVHQLLSNHQPRTIVLVCGPMDFYKIRREQSISLNYSEVTEFINGRKPYWYFALRHFDFIYYIQHRPTIRMLRSSSRSYNSVCFDKWGGVVLDITYPDVDSHRWNAVVDVDSFDSVQYEALNNLADFVMRQNIRLVAVQPPLKVGSVPSAIQPKLEQHWARVADILSKRNFVFVNYQSRLGESHFADYSHLNKRGARAFTECFSRQYLSD